MRSILEIFTPEQLELECDICGTDIQIDSKGRPEACTLTYSAAEKDGIMTKLITKQYCVCHGCFALKIEPHLVHEL